MSIWLPDQQDAVAIVSTDVLDATQWDASHSPIAFTALTARECPNEIQRSKGAAVGIHCDSLVMSTAVANLESRSLAWVNNRMKHPVKIGWNGRTRWKDLTLTAVGQPTGYLLGTPNLLPIRPDQIEIRLLGVYLRFTMYRMLYEI